MMETLIVYGLLALVGMVLLRALLPARPTQPQIIYVVAEPQVAQSRLGCLLPVVVIIGLLVALRMMGM
jgi:hypothetical protein